MSTTYEYPRPALTVDAVVFGLDDEDLKVLLIRRGEKPFKGRWALPGVFVHVGESLEKAVRRGLKKEAGIVLFLEQLYTFGDKVNRDPREHTVTVAYYALVNLKDYPIKAGTDEEEAAWFPVSRAPKLAFDHRDIVAKALERLKGKIRYQPIGFKLLPPQFTLSQLQRLYEKILGKTLDKRNFRKKVLGMDFLVPLKEVQKGVAHRAARLYRFDEEKYQQLQERGFNFEI